MKIHSSVALQQHMARQHRRAATSSVIVQMGNGRPRGIICMCVARLSLSCRRWVYSTQSRGHELKCAAAAGEQRRLRASVRRGVPTPTVLQRGDAVVKTPACNIIDIFDRASASKQQLRHQLPLSWQMKCKLIFGALMLFPELTSHKPALRLLSSICAAILT